MAIRLSNNPFTSEKLTSTDLNDTFGVLGNSPYILGNLHLTLLHQSVNPTTQYFKGDIYTDNNGYLNTIDAANTTAYFSSDLYCSLPPAGEDVYSNPSEVSTQSASFVVVKTFNVDKSIYHITSEIRRYPSYAGTVYLKAQFTDAEGSWDSTEATETGGVYVSKTLYNPYPERIPTTVDYVTDIHYFK